MGWFQFVKKLKIKRSFPVYMSRKNVESWVAYNLKRPPGAFYVLRRKKRERKTALPLTVLKKGKRSLSYAASE